MYRASELGGCIKALVAARLGYDKMEAPTNFQTMFKEGNLHEEAVISSLMDDGYEIDDRQKEVNLNINSEIIVQGHLDGMVLAPLTMSRKVLEVKSVSQDAWKELINLRWDTPGLIQKYKWQLSSYMLGMDAEALVVFKNRNTGELRFEGVEVPFYSFNEIQARILEIEDWVGKDTLPDECSWNQYPCPYYYLHTDKETDDSEVDYVAVGQAASAYLAAKQSEEEASALTRLARENLIQVMAGKEKIKKEGLSITYYDYTTTTLNKTKMKADGIELEKYESKTVSKRLRVKLDEPETD